MTSRRKDRPFPAMPPDEPGPPIHVMPFVLAIFLIVMLMGLLLFMGTR